VLANTVCGAVGWSARIYLQSSTYQPARRTALATLSVLVLMAATAGRLSPLTRAAYRRRCGCGLSHAVGLLLIALVVLLLLGRVLVLLSGPMAVSCRMPQLESHLLAGISSHFCFEMPANRAL